MRISDSDLKRLLLLWGKLDPAAVDEAVKMQEETKEPLLSVVVSKKKLLTEKQLLELYAKSIDLPFVDLAEVKIDHNILVKIPERIARKYQVVLFGEEDGLLQLAMVDPEDFQAADFIEKQIGDEVKAYVASPADVTAALDQYKGSISTEITQAIKDSSEQEEKIQDVSPKDLTEDAPIAKTVNIVIEYAIKSRASDIHIEPRENIVQVRYRVDGVLRETMTLPKPILPAVISRIKILANLKIDEHRVPQDGRFKFSVGSKTVALRVSTLPVMDGEKVVMRLLDESTRALTLQELGFDGHSLEVIQHAMVEPHGMLLVTGPTGSGKSTTLYSILSTLNTPGVNISTIEDPVEYRILGVNQTQVNSKTGMTFAAGLRALLRQDPNIIMVGEIRDGETANLAVQAALTGHVVLSTLHTNNAATTLPRLLDMGIEPFLIASTVNAVIGQRLVRRLCQVCRIPYVPAGHELDDLKESFQVDIALKHYKELKGEIPSAPAEPAHEGDKEGEHEDDLAASGPKRKRQKVIWPPEEIESSKSILDRIAADPNILNRSAEDAKKAKQAGKDTPAPVAQLAPTAPEAKQETPTPKEIDPSQLKSGEFIIYKVGPGCDMCGHAGYQGRLGIYEVLEVDDAVSKMIVTHATSEEIQLASIRAGMMTMQQDGFIKSLAGLTTIEEVLRVTRE